MSIPQVTAGEDNLENISPSKRFKLANGKCLKRCTLSSEELELININEKRREFERQKIQHWQTYERVKRLRSPNDSFAVPQNPNPEGSLNKFKAKPVPKTLYRPHLLVKASTKPPTVPQEFSLSQSPVPSIHKKSCVSPASSTPFKARPMPNFSPSPINFATPTKRETKQITPFKARPMPDFSSPFTPTSSTKLTLPEPFSCHSEKRATQRQLFQDQVREKQQKLEEERIVQETQTKLFEEEQVKLIRKQSTFKARPLPAFIKQSKDSHTCSLEDMDIDMQLE